MHLYHHQAMQQRRNMNTRYAISIALIMTSRSLWSTESAVPLLDRLVACTAITADQARLACLDQELAPLARARVAPTAVQVQPRAATPEPPAATPPAPATPPSPPVAETALPSFGNEQLSAGRKPAINLAEQELHARITELRTAASNRFMVTLDNGQIWRHEDAHRGSYLKVGEAITIRKGTLGSYRLTQDEGSSSNWIRVTRIR